MIINELKATSNLSYYGKPKVIIHENGVKYLKSYNTIVCAIDDKNNFVRIWDKYSATTQKHVNDFCMLYGFKALSGKEWKKLEVSKNFDIPVEVENVSMKYTATYNNNFIA